MDSITVGMLLAVCGSTTRTATSCFHVWQRRYPRSSGIPSSSESQAAAAASDLVAEDSRRDYQRGGAGRGHQDRADKVMRVHAEHREDHSSDHSADQAERYISNHAVAVAVENLPGQPS